MVEATSATQEKFPAKRVQSIVFGSFELSQNKPHPQQNLLAWAAAKHPDLLKPLRKELADPDSPLVKIIQQKLRSGSHARIYGDNDTSIRMQVGRNDDIFKIKRSGPLSPEVYLPSAVVALAREDLLYMREDKGRKRKVDGKDITVWKSYFIEHVLLGIEYKGDKIWQEFLSECHSYLFSEQKSESAQRRIETYSILMWALIDKYNKALAEGKYTNKDPRCVPIDAKTVPFLAPYRQRYEKFLSENPDYFDKDQK